MFRMSSCLGNFSNHGKSFRKLSSCSSHPMKSAIDPFSLMTPSESVWAMTSCISGRRTSRLSAFALSFSEVVCLLSRVSLYLACTFSNTSATVNSRKALCRLSMCLSFILRLTVSLPNTAFSISSVSFTYSASFTSATSSFCSKLPPVDCRYEMHISTRPLSLCAAAGDPSSFRMVFFSSRVKATCSTFWRKSRVFTAPSSSVYCIILCLILTRGLPVKKTSSRYCSAFAKS
mmetsp:Transcript_18877/g.36488  ORF Transcript_18877/g.36488 Transcript_18877/m.36488 type:complete len:232 (+) Transcript_18877:264-959(+)